MSPQEPSTNSLSAVDLSYAQFNDTNYSPDTKPSEPVTETCFKRSDPEIKLSEECTAPFDRKLIVLTAPEQTTPCAPPEHSFAHLVAKNLAQLASRASESTSIVMVYAGSAVALLAKQIERAHCLECFFFRVLPASVLVATGAYLVSKLDRRKAEQVREKKPLSDDEHQIKAHDETHIGEVDKQ